MASAHRYCRWLFLGAVLGWLIGTSPAHAWEVTQTFASNPAPGWERSGLTGTPSISSKFQDFHWQPSNHAGSSGGEIGGTLTRTEQTDLVPAYARATATRGPGHVLYVKGYLKVTAGSSGDVHFGFFNWGTSRSWRTRDSFALRMDAGSSNYRMFLDLGSSGWRGQGIEVHNSATGDGRWTIGTRYAFNMRYDRDFYGTGQPGMRLFVQDTGGLLLGSVDTHVDPLMLADGFTVNRVGIFGQHVAGSESITAYFDNLTIYGEGSGEHTFPSDPMWSCRDCNATVMDSIHDGEQTFDWSSTSHAGGSSPACGVSSGAAGEIGGRVWRTDPKPTKAYFADHLGTPYRDLDDPLHLCGRIALRSATADATSLIGYFDKDDQSVQGTKLPDSFLGIQVNGSSLEGMYVMPAWHSSGSERSSTDYFHTTTPGATRIFPSNGSTVFDMYYTPLSNGSATITLAVDAGPARTFTVPAAARTQGAEFDRFGLLANDTDHGHDLELYADNLTYTAG